MNVTLRQLRVFIAVSRLHSFSRAGDEIGLTQSAVSRCVRELEAEVGLKLIDRTTREVQLTEVGRSLGASVARLLSDLDAALREVKELGEQRRGRVIVAASPTVACRLLPMCLARCVAHYPLITLVLRDDVQADVLRQVKSGEVDFGVVVGPLAPDDFLVEPLMTDPFCLICRADDPLAQLDQISWRSLDGRRLIMLDQASGSRPIIDAIFREHGVEAQVVQELGHPATVFGLVQAGLGVSVLPSLALPLPAGSMLVARELVPRAERTVALVRRRERSLSPAAHAVWQLIQQLPARVELL
jgi:DNA-binding transcriptional LysR family regulator